MEKDIAPELLELLEKCFDEKVEENIKIPPLLKAIHDGKATYIEAEDYAFEIGSSLAAVFRENLSSDILPDGKMYYNIADRVIRPMLVAEYALAADTAVQVQTSMNQKAGIGIKAQQIEVNENRIQGIIDRVSAADIYDEVAWILGEPVVNLCQSAVDEVLKANVEFQGRAGLRPRIIRKAERKCCKWCSRLAGEYNYPNLPHEVYQRHENCRCTVDYDPGDGKRFQNVHTKQWQSSEERARIEARKQVGIKSLPASLAEHPMRLASYTPESLLAALKREGFEIKPLKIGSLKDIPFEEGGGYKVNFEDGGILQYHPATKSHHGGAYYKISTGKGGRHRYDIDGAEKFD